MSYEWDVFISYKRHPESREWLTDHFQPLLAHWLEQELGDTPKIFRDDANTETGVTWPAHLGQALGKARTLVALWSKTYFHSDWCTLELSTMLGRERDEQLRTEFNPGGLVVPVILHDCESIRDVPELAPILHVPELKEAFTCRLERNSPEARALEKQIRYNIAPGLAAAIDAAPPWREEWPSETAKQFLAKLHKPARPRQTDVPRISR